MKRAIVAVLAAITTRMCALCLVFTVALSSGLSAQVPIREIHTATGWVPPTRKMVLSTEAESVTVDNLTVAKRVITLKDEMVLRRPVFSVDKETLVLYEAEQTCFLRKVIAYSLNDVTFAYEVPCVAGGIENGGRVYAGASYVDFYYDDTGDGQFKTRFIGRTSLVIPKWMKRSGNR